MQMTDQQLLEYALRITALVNAPEHMTVRAAAAVVEAAMRAEQQARIDKGDAHA
jgi:hypothetical protein